MRVKTSQRRRFGRKVSPLRWVLLIGLPLAAAAGGVELSGRLAVPSSLPEQMLAGVRVFGFPNGSRQGNGFRTWEMEPRGWWKLEGGPGQWNVLCTGPSHFMRPCVLNVPVAEGSNLSSLRPRPHFDYACFAESAWDTQAARAYWQPFTARSRSVTHVGFKLATDGVDGPGPGAATMVLSIHRCTQGAPQDWPQVGPAMSVPGVDCGGPKSYHYSAGWHSGEVILDPGARYAVHLRAEKAGAGVQAFWEESLTEAAWRAAGDGSTAPAGHRLWMTVSGDGDGLLIPCNKRVHREFGDFVNFKNQVNDRKPGFNPYLRPATDPYAGGEAWKLGRDKAARDLDMQVVEFAGP